jgi:hypothetical protein
MRRSDYVGVTYVTGTSAYSEPFGAFTALTASVLDAATVWNDLSGTAVASMPVPVGSTIHGHISSLKLASGSGLAYRV